MRAYSECLEVLQQLFGREYSFMLATVKNNEPSVGMVDTIYEDGAFWIVTYATAGKADDISSNPNVALANRFHNFKGKAYYMGHPLKPENRKIRERMIQAFHGWYFRHNNEGDENMCYVKVVPEKGFVHKDGAGYLINFVEKSVRKTPFLPDIKMIH